MYTMLITNLTLVFGSDNLAVLGGYRFECFVFVIGISLVVKKFEQTYNIPYKGRLTSLELSELERDLGIQLQTDLK
jgi:hypothetical protein